MSSLHLVLLPSSDEPGSRDSIGVQPSLRPGQGQDPGGKSQDPGGDLETLEAETTPFSIMTSKRTCDV